MNLFAFSLHMVVILSIAKEGYSIRCYECNSHTDPRCAEKIPPAELEKDCSEHKNGPIYTFCRKITQEIDFSVNNLPPDTRYIRTCGYEVGAYKNKCYHRSGFGGRHEVCACEEDLCNSAVNTKATFGIFFLTIALVYFARI